MIPVGKSQLTNQHPLEKNLEMYSQNQVPFKKNKKSAKECSNAEKTEMQGTKAETR